MTRTAVIRIIAFFLLAAGVAVCQKGPSVDGETRTWNSLPDAPSWVQLQADRFHAFAKEANSPLKVGAAGISAGMKRDFTLGVQARGVQASQADLYLPLPAQKESGASAFFGKRLYPLLLKQAARHYPLTGDSFLGRASYAASRMFVMRNDSGKRRPNTSFFLRALTSVATHSGNANRPYWAQSARDVQRLSHP